MRSALLCAALALHACSDSQDVHDHSSSHPAGHDHHEEGHGHGGEEMVRITRWTDSLELFAEHPRAVAGKELHMLAHLTVLDGFKPATGASVRLVLEGPARAESKPAEAAAPGIYRLSVTPPEPGTYRGTLIVEGATEGRFDGLELVVGGGAPERDAHGHEHGDEHGRGHEHGDGDGDEHGHEHGDGDEHGHEHGDDDDHDDVIEFLKEQQWGVPMATAFARTGQLVASTEVAGTVTTPPGDSAEVGAPVAGRLSAASGGLPHPGQEVKKGQLLATLSPSPSSPEGAAQAGLAIAEAEARVAAQTKALERAERLLAERAISQKEVEDARRDLGVAREAVRAARQAAALYAGASGGGGRGSWRLVAPIAGTVVEVNAAVGASVEQGEVLFRILDGKEIWLRARIPEQDAARFRSDRDAAYQITGLAQWHPLDLTGDDRSAAIVSVGRTVDAKTRTVDVIYSLKTPPVNLRVGGLVKLSVPTGPDVDGIVIPTTAIVDHRGAEVVYVQVDGEHFEERIVRTGPRGGGQVAIVSGLAAGERIVVKGATLVRLADQSSETTPHGHIH